MGESFTRFQPKPLLAMNLAESRLLNLQLGGRPSILVLRLVKHLHDVLEDAAVRVLLTVQLDAGPVDFYLTRPGAS